MFSSPLTATLEVTILAVMLLYAAGALRVWQRAGWGHGLPVWRAGCFLAGILLLTLLLARPMDDLAERSFAAHMLQHVILMKAIPPLLLLGQLSVCFLHTIGSATAHSIRSAWLRLGVVPRAWGTMSSPWFAWSFFAISMWMWHVPPLYDAALRSEWLHVLEHAMFFGSSLLFWWYILQPGADRAIRYGTVVLYLFTTLLHESVLGALLTFSASSWYSFYSGLDLWGLKPLADQQLAGLIMWIPGGLLFGFLMTVYFGAWLRAIERRMRSTHPEYASIGDRHD